eukprot:8497340-Alexandrium_andersonii.AAC.1
MRIKLETPPGISAPSPGAPREAQRLRGWALQSGVSHCWRTQRRLRGRLGPFARLRPQPRPAGRWLPTHV